MYKEFVNFKRLTSPIKKTRKKCVKFHGVPFELFDISPQVKICANKFFITAEYIFSKFHLS